MRLTELFETLELPDDNDGGIFSAMPIPDYPTFRVAVDSFGFPILLLTIANRGKVGTLKNFKLKYLQLIQNVDCKIIESGNATQQQFTVIKFTCDDKLLQNYFLQIAEPFLKSLNSKPTHEQVTHSFNRFIEVFRALSDVPTKTIQGLWSELFFIDSCNSPEVMLNYWHQIPEEKFDFNSGIEKIEVKSSGNFERIHIFSSEQLHPPTGDQVIIVSLFVRQSSSGKTVQDLIENIASKISDIELIEKMNSIVCKTLGSSLEQSLKIKFDNTIALDSMKLYKHQDIVKIEEVHIPNEVSEVKYKSDLTNIKPLDLFKFSPKNKLYNAV